MIAPRTAASGNTAAGQADETSRRDSKPGPTRGSGDASGRLRAVWLLGVAPCVWVATFLVLRACVADHERAFRWDAGWYLSVALQDYHFDGDITHQQSVAFLPGYPFLLRWLLALGLPAQATVLLVCIGCSIGGTLLLFRALSDRLGPATSAWACALTIASPFSLYFLNGYSESLYFLTMGAFWWALLRRRDDGLSALFAAMAGIVRPFGIVLALVWAIDLFLRRREIGWRRVAVRLVSLGPLAIAGPMVVCLYYAYRFGDLFLYRNILLAWGADVVTAGATDVLDQFRVEWATLLEWHPTLMLAWPPELARLLLWAFPVVAVLAWRRLPLQLLIYGFGLIAFCLLTTAGAENLGRHLATNVALPAGIAVLLGTVPVDAQRGTRPSRHAASAILFIAGLIVQMYYASMYFRGDWVS